LADGGYLSNPDEEWGKAYNPDLLTLEEISDAPCLVLLGEPGMGKSRELDKLQNLTEQKISWEDQVLPLNLRSCTNLKNGLFKDEVFLDWLESNYHLYLFLDSLDEGRLSVPTIATGLIDELQKKKYEDHLHRLHIRIACRTFAFSEISEVLETGLKELWQETEVGIYELVPLRRVDVALAAGEEGFSSDKFLKEIDQKDVVPLAIKPITLEFLLNTYRKHNGQFPPDQKLYDLYLEGCKLLCEEVNPGRRASKQVGSLDTDQRLIVAARIAAVTIFTNRFAVWTGVDQGNVPIEDVSLQELCVGYETVQAREFEIDRKVIEEVLDTGLFSSRGLNRMGWAHQTYAEFLAAWYLLQHEVSLEQIKHLLFLSENKGYRIVPQLYETAAWLISMRDDVLQMIMETDPDVLLQSDLSGVDQGGKAAILASLLELHDSGKLVYQYDGFNKFKHLSHAGILGQLESYISDSTKNFQSRYVAIDIAESCDLQDASPSLVKVALSSENPYLVRARAARFVATTGSEVDKIKLKDLYTLPQDDPEDDLRAYGLSATYPKHITTEEVLSYLTQPQANYFGGRYQRFVAHDLGERLPESDLEMALEWVKKQPVKHESHYPFDALADSILLRAWEHLDNPAILSIFAEIVVSRQSQYAQVIDNHGSVSFRKILQDDDFKRRALIEKCVSIIQHSDGDPYWLSGNSQYSSLTPLKQDFIWLIEKLVTASSDSMQRVYAKLIYWELDRNNAEQISLVITTSQTNSILKEEFSPTLDFVPLNSQRARESKSQYLERQQHLIQREQNQLNPPPKIRVLQCLDRFEAGQVDAWWLLCREMTLLPTSTHYNRPWEVDITTLPGWEEADETVRHRIIDAAKQYIYAGDSNTANWLGKNSFPHSVIGGYQALRLISVKDPEFIAKLPGEVWQNWAAIILDFPNAREDKNKEIREGLLRRAYKNAPNEFLGALGILIDQENSQHGSVNIHREVECCWDEGLESFLLAKVQGKTISPEGLDSLLDVLLAHQVQEAISFAESLITLPLPENEKDRKKVAVAAQNLILYSADTAWPKIWRIVEEYPEFGKAVFEKISFSLKYSGTSEKQIKPEYLADLYIFLLKQYPDPDTESQIDSEEGKLSSLRARSIGPEDSIRMWRDSIPQKLQDVGTPEACQALQHLIDELPELKEQLQWRLPQAEALTRRKIWQPPTPEQFFQLVISQEPSNSDLFDQIDVIERRTEKMEKEPKIDKSVRIDNSNVSGVVNTGDGSIQHETATSDTSRKLDWKFWFSIGLTILIGLGSAAASGVFNDHLRNFLFRENTPSSLEENSNSD
jgi:predicted NACHT family NTPase